MKILLVNKFWYPRGGAETHVLALKTLLESKGHHVMFFGVRDKRNIRTGYEHYFVNHMDMRAREGLLRAIRKAAHVIYSTEAARNLDALLSAERPDIAHLHNTYHHLSPSILSVLRRHKVPVVMTLHDWKLVCPNYSMIERERICEECCGRSFWKTALHRSLRGDFFPSLVVTLEAALERALNLYGSVHTFICPSEFQQKKIRALYAPRSGRFVTLHNFIQCPPSVVHSAPRDFFVFVGRLSPEKGVRYLLEASARFGEAPLRIIGDGPEALSLKREVAHRRLQHITFMGTCSRATLMRTLGGARALIVPSVSLEIYPTVAIEALCMGTPVIASRIGGIPEIVRDGASGLLVSPRSSPAILDAMKKLWYDETNAEHLGAAGAREVRRRNDPKHFYAALMDIYRTACDTRAGSYVRPSRGY